MTSIFLPVLLFAVTMTATPGPNNMLLTASGARFGYRRTIPLIAGIVLGLISQLILFGLGMGALFSRFPLLKGFLKTAGTLYILYLAWSLAFGGGKKKKGAADALQPFSLQQGALFQYLNPKAYVMTLTAMAVYPLPGEAYLPSALMITALFAVITPLSISLWAAFGTVLGRVMTGGNKGQTINRILGGITAASAIFILL